MHNSLAVRISGEGRDRARPKVERRLARVRTRAEGAARSRMTEARRTGLTVRPVLESVHGRLGIMSSFHYTHNTRGKQRQLTNSERQPRRRGHNALGAIHDILLRSHPGGRVGRLGEDGKVVQGPRTAARTRSRTGCPPRSCRCSPVAAGALVPEAQFTATFFIWRIMGRYTHISSF